MYHLLTVKVQQPKKNLAGPVDDARIGDLSFFPTTPLNFSCQRSVLNIFQQQTGSIILHPRRKVPHHAGAIEGLVQAQLFQNTALFSGAQVANRYFL